MALTRPNHTMVLDLDESLATNETKLEVQRCFAHIGTPLVRSHAAAGDEPATNKLRLIVSVGTRKYLMSSEEGADELWDETVSPSISNMLHKIGGNMKAFNRRQRKIGMAEIVLDRYDIELQGGKLVVGLHPDAASSVGRKQRGLIDLARTLVNDGTLAGAVRIDMPAESSWSSQSESARATWEADRQDEAEEADDPGAGQVDEEERHRREIAERALADHDLGTERFFDEEWLAADAERKSYENTAVEPVDSDDLPPAFHLPEIPEPEQFNFDVDYRIWEVAFEDDSKRLFDSEARAFAQ